MRREVGNNFGTRTALESDAIVYAILDQGDTLAPKIYLIEESVRLKYGVMRGRRSNVAFLGA
jgi:hypothetical protein